MGGYQVAYCNQFASKFASNFHAEQLDDTASRAPCQFQSFPPAASVQERSCLLLATLLAVPSASAAPTDDVYSLGPDSLPHEGVPQGKTIGPLTLASQVFTNTTRHYWILCPGAIRCPNNRRP
jgi:hypothetical protein